MSKLYVNEVHSKTGSTKALDINSNGIVRFPKRPIFSVELSSSLSITSNGEYFPAYTVIKHDTNGDYNSSNGKFTAPVDGVYYFWHHHRFDNVGSGYIQAQLWMNNTTAVHRSIEGSPASSYQAVNGMYTLPLVVGDTIQIRFNVSADTSYQVNNSSFGGHLLD